MWLRTLSRPGTDVSRDQEARPDAGVALILVLLLTVLLSAAGMALLLVADMETTMAANHRDSVRVLHAAEGAAEFVTQELSLMNDWTAVLNGSVTSRLGGPSVLPSALGRTPVDLPGLTTALQRAVYGGAWWGGDTPVWRLFGQGVPALDIPFAGLPNDTYAIIWVSDDTGEADGDPSADTNGTVVVRARAIGRRQARADVQAVIARVSPGVVRRVSSRVVR